jgi:hypothetical protein
MKKTFIHVVIACTILFVCGGLLSSAQSKQEAETMPSSQNAQLSNSEVTLPDDGKLQNPVEAQMEAPLKKSLVYSFDDGGYPEIADILCDFFENYYAVLETGSLSDFDLEKLDPISYLIMKEQVFQYSSYKIHYGGISDVEVSQLTVLNVTDLESHMEVEVYAGASYQFAGERSGQGTIFTLKIKNRQVTEIRAESSDIDCRLAELENAKAVHGKSIFTDDELFKIIDELFSGKSADIVASDNESATGAVSINEMENEIEVTRSKESARDIGENVDNTFLVQTISVSYDAASARSWGYWLGDKYDNYVFKRSSPDCTNFVSQCIWAGYGGTSGYTI